MEQAAAAAARNVEIAVARTVARHRLWPAGAALVVAVSGGADSLCLLGTLLALRAAGHPLAPERLIVAHLDHGLRAESAADAAWVADFAAREGLPCVTERVDVAALARAERRSLEDAGRQARYAFLHRVAAQEGADCICTGHTRDDQAETVLLHLVRGSGLAGLAGMRPREGDLARPLLETPRAATEGYYAARGWQPREDASNRDTRFLRNRVRHELLPLLETFNPGLRAVLARNADLLAADEAYLDEQTDIAWNACLYSAHMVGDGVAFDLEALRYQPPALRSRLYRRAFAALVGEGVSLTARHLQMLERLVVAGDTGKALTLEGGVRVALGYETLTFALAAEAPDSQPAASGGDAGEVALPVPGMVELPEMGWRVRAWYADPPAGISDVGLPPPPEWPAFGYVGVDAQRGQAEMRTYLDAAVAEADGATLHVRTWRPGDRFRPLGMAHEKKLQDFFADAKVPRALRPRVPIVASAAHILWVAGMRVDDRARVTPDTLRLIVLQLEPLAGE